MIRIVLCVLICGVTACTPVRIVSTETNPESDFSIYQTYNFYTDDARLASNPNLRVLMDAISREMNQRGFTLDDSPDLMINIAVDKEEKVQTRETDFRDAPVYMGTRNYSWQSEEIVVREYEEGTVKLDLVDTDQGALVWQGIAAGTVDGNQAKMKSRIDKAIDLLFRNFPIEEKNE